MAEHMMKNTGQRRAVAPLFKPLARLLSQVPLCVMLGMVGASTLALVVPAAGFAETSAGGSLIKAAQEHFEAALKRTAAGDHIGAIIELTQAITIDPKYGKAYANRAASRFNVQDYKGAIADIDVSFKYFPGMPFLVDLRQKCETALNGSASNNNAAAEQQRAAANQMLLNAVVGGGDMADPSTLLMMQARRNGLMNGGARTQPMSHPAQGNAGGDRSGNSPFAVTDSK